MKQEINKIKYFLYARKSSESEDRQVASIESQIDELKKLADREGLKIVEIFQESKSAKAPGRIMFNQMIERVYKGEIQGILCWKLDRLARNPVDGGNINWMLQQGVIQHIRAYDKSYYPTDNVLMMSVEFGMANQFIRDLSQNTKRGLRARVEKGVYPAPAPFGYINEKYAERGNKTILTDPERFDVIRKMFDLMLTGTYTVLQILRIVNEEWKFRTPKGSKLGRSTIYKIFTRPFYYGMFEYPIGSGNWVKGIHRAMITEEEYDKIQILLGRKGRPRPKSHIFEFTGMMKCEECGGMITAEEKIKHQKNGNVHHYIYYHCTKRKNPNCKQGSIEINDLKKQVVKAMDELKIAPIEFHEWAMKWFRSENEKESEGRSAILSTQQKAYNLCIKKLNGLIDMRAAGEISNEEFGKKKKELSTEKDHLMELLSDTNQRVDSWLQTADDMFKFVRDAIEKFNTGSLGIKRQILAALGQNLIVKDKKLIIDLENSLIPLKIIAKEVKTIHKRLEPTKKPIDKAKLELAYERNPRLLRGLDSNQGDMIQSHVSYR